ncbi:hypothetical protein DY042_05500 [Apilactobacillus kunkeei]|uniref:Kinase n=1 Tax=Apilactobacillus kunkeei TaxID=148814 RepID=A0AAC8ZYM1_9LACO|nr:kinase [Apilactobacillus kunkeei]ALJ31067.1 hypothetical protein APS55_01965 [Apilactobacillus kunkeei]KFJ15575.1 hypothetical protein JI66_01710 [Apilactobacillus kunkeei]MCX0326468.1 kinase [Apilactobacillus kunkeei]TPR50258.1 hypothetical protein DY042_05500 [Apilactobacillus kunkeei]UZX33380.1 kinase [Apilactobacillus kunkeei]
MDPVLIVLRGNAVTGKTSVASSLQERLGTTDVMLVQQDISEEHVDMQIQMIQKLVNYGKKHFHYVILDGVLPKDSYGEMLHELIEDFGRQQLVYYFNDSFEQTVKYNEQKIQPHDIDKLKSWWIDSDLISDEDVKLENGGIEQYSDQIIDDINDLPLF